MPTNTTEFHIQKRGLAVWQYVTWYETYEEAKKNFDRLVMGKGYSYRIVELKVMDEAKLEGEREDEAPGSDVLTTHHFVTPKPTEPVKSSWGAPVATGWGKPAVIDPTAPEPKCKTCNGDGYISASFPDVPDAKCPDCSPKPEHGLTGSVWVGNLVTKEKKRVSMPQSMLLLNEGWIKVGPRTQL